MDTVAWAVPAFVTLTDQSRKFSMLCPKCHSEFEQIVFAGIAIDRCTICKGLWFDMLEKEDLLKIKGSEEIDLGPEQVDPKYAAMRDIECPRCAQTMLATVDKDQYHIKFETCPACYGTFFDAGEFQDLKEHTVLERFNQMMLTISSKFK